MRFTSDPWLRFCPTLGSPDPGTIFLDLEDFKRQTRLFLSFSPLTILKGPPIHQLHSSLRNKSSFDPAAPYQLEHIFDWIDIELHRHTYKLARNRKLTQLEFTSLKHLRQNQDIIIKPADKVSAIVIMDKQYYIDEGIIFLFLWRTTNRSLWGGHSQN